MTATILSPVVAALDLKVMMREALAEAEAAGRVGELPIGSVLVIDGQIVSRGRARHRQRRSQLCHAEMEALQAGGERLWTRYQWAVLFSTVEPCPMCLGAAVMADVSHIVFAAHDAVAGMGVAVESIPYLRRHIETYLGGVLEAESHEVVGRYDAGSLAYIRGSQRTDR